DNARFARVLLRLEAHGAIDDGRKEAEAILGEYAGDLSLAGPRAVEAALAVQELLDPPLTATVFGPAGGPATAALRRAALDLPKAWMVVRSGGGSPPRVELAWRGATERVGRPADLAAALQRIRAADRP